MDPATYAKRRGVKKPKIWLEAMRGNEMLWISWDDAPPEVEPAFWEIYFKPAVKPVGYILLSRPKESDGPAIPIHGDFGWYYARGVDKNGKPVTEESNEVHIADERPEQLDSRFFS